MKTFFYVFIEESDGVQRREKQIKENQDNFQERRQNFKENEVLTEKDQMVKCQRPLLASETLTAQHQELKYQKVEYYKRDQILRNNEDKFQERKKNFKDSEEKVEKYQRQNCQKLQKRERLLKVKQDKFEQICSNVETEMLSKEHNLILAQETLELEKTTFAAQQKVLKDQKSEFKKKDQDLRRNKDKICKFQEL